MANRFKRFFKRTNLCTFVAFLHYYVSHVHHFSFGYFVDSSP